MAGPFSFTGWGTSAITPARTPEPPLPKPPAPGTPVNPPAVKKGNSLGGGIYAGKGSGAVSGSTPVKPPLAKPTTGPVAPAAPGGTMSVQTGGGAAAPGSFSFTGWSSSRIVPKVASAPIVQGTAGNIPANAIPIGQGGPATGTGGIPDTITQAQNTLETFSNPTLLGFFQNLLNQGKGGGVSVMNPLSPTQEALNSKKLNLINEPDNLAAQLRTVLARKAAAGPAPFGGYAGSEQQRIDNQMIDLQTRLGPASQFAGAAGGLASPYSAVSNPSASGIVKNAGGWVSSPWQQNVASTGVSRGFSPMGGMI